MSKAEALLRRREAVTPRGIARLNDVVVASGSGAVLKDVDGRSLIDFASGIGVMTVGHCQPPIVEALARQAKLLQHACIHVSTYEPYVELCEKLVDLFPHGDATKVMLINSGAEAVENAVKIARQATGRPAVITFTESFHGRTLLCLSLTSKVGYKKGCGPFAPEVYRLPFPNFYRRHDGLEPDAFVQRELRRFREALVNTVAPEQVAAVLIEVLQGEGGFVPAPDGYLQGLRSICDEHGIMLIVDEVQTGFCRTGRWAAYQHHGVTPDLSTWAKAMGGGLPISAVMGKAEVMDKALPGTLGGTYGGNPVACASALAAIDLMERQDLVSRARLMGDRMRERLEALRARCAAIGDVRGLGAMLAMEFVHDGDPSRPAGEILKPIVKGCIDEGLLVITAGAHGNIMRLLPPLVITDDELERGLGILESQILKHAGGRP